MPVDAMMQRYGMPVDVDLDEDSDPVPWSRISYTDDRDSLPGAEPSCRWVFESVRGGVDPIG